MERYQSVYVAGHGGMVGSAMVRRLKLAGYDHLISAPRGAVDLRDAHQVDAFFARMRPAVVILAAARVGGIQSNRTYPADYLYDNLMIQSNVIHQAHRHGVAMFVFLGSSCIYPRECPQPMREEYLLTGPLEPTNEGYALAKIAGIRLAQFYDRQHGMACLCPMPCNLYGPNDSFDPQKSHVLSALVKKFVDAANDGTEEVVMWGTGSARREFLHVDDLARAVLLLMEKHQSPEIINVGAGTDVSIRELAEMIAAKVSYTGRLKWDHSMPDGMPRKCLEVSRMQSLGFTPDISLADGIDGVIAEYRAFKASSFIHPTATTPAV